MKQLKRILRWVVGIVLTVWLALILLFSLPFVQRWLADVAENTLSDLLKTRVEVGRIQMGLSGRLIADDIRIWDQQQKEMLSISRAGARLDLMPLIRRGDIHINNALLFTVQAHLYQQQENVAPNFQFVIDALKSKDEQKKPMPTITVSSILVRHTSVQFDQLWKEKTPGKFNPAHINIKDLSLAAQLDILNDDTLSMSLKKLSMQEQSGLQLLQTELEVNRSKNTFLVSDMLVKLPHSELSSPLLSINPKEKYAEGDIKLNVLPVDLKALYPALSQLTNAISLETAFKASTQEIYVKGLQMNTEDGSISMDVPAFKLTDIKDSIPGIDTRINLVQINPQALNYVTPFVKNLPEKVTRIVNQVGNTSLQGQLNYQNGKGDALLTLVSELGKLNLEGKIQDRLVNAKVDTEGFKAGNILTALSEKSANDSTSILGNVAFTATADLNLPAKGKLPDGSINANIQEVVLKNYAYHNINLNARKKGQGYELKAEAKDPSATFNLNGNAYLSAKSNTLQLLADIERLQLRDLHLTKGKIQNISTKIGIDLNGEKLDNLAGNVSIPHVIITDEEGSYTLSHIQLESHPLGEERHLQLQSPYLSGKADGICELADLKLYIQQTIHNWIPGIVKAPVAAPAACQANISLSLTDPYPLERLAGIPLRLDKGPLNIACEADSKQGTLVVKASAPEVGYGSEKLLNVFYDTYGKGKQMETYVSLSRMMRESPVDLAIKIGAKDSILSTRADWDNHLQPVTMGSIALQGKIQQDSEKALSIEGEVMPTSLQINDTLWNILPTHLSFHNGLLKVDDFRLTMEDGNRWLAIKGMASKSEEDTLHVNLRGIDLDYIFQLARIKPLSLGGQVTGDIYGVSLFSSPMARGHVIVPHILFNQGDMGTCDAQLAWGVTPGTLDINAQLTDLENHANIDAQGYLHLVKDPIQSLDLSFDCKRANCHFLNRYVAGIMQDIEGRATGKVRIYGPFKEIEMQGMANIEEAALTIPSLNVRYHVQNETVVLKPTGIELKNVVGYDPMGGPDIPDHRGIINGTITYEHFKNMRYNFNVRGENILAYNFPEFDDLPFCGVVYGSGGVQISGSPGISNIDIDARPTRGTLLTYKVATPETLTQSKFITFIDRNAAPKDEDKESKEVEEEKPESDMNITFNLDITPDAEMRLLMDPIAGDYISLYGNSRLRATYYNKGNFRMYGTYRVDHGIYRMSIQDVIRKDFQFRKDGAIVFGGSPFQADLNLQAIYTVPSVSLNDLSARGTFSNNNVRVDCIMNLGGKAGEPKVTFDFDIPNVNEDERRMVRSLISTEEERNLQVIYLLGIGRFYTYDYTGSQTQSSTAMNSLLSSTISGQLNQMFTSLMGGNQNWNIGANLSTGDMGWSDMDVEGMLSGRLLNNRLLINGNFGYRDNPVAASNFIGDFDLQWILNKQGNLILKAYSETNDRYFTKSSLTTQGVGLLLKKDFIHWSDLFRRRNKQQ